MSHRTSGNKIQLREYIDNVQISQHFGVWDLTVIKMLLLHKKHYAHITNTKSLLLFREIRDIYCEKPTEQNQLGKVLLKLQQLVSIVTNAP